ncbi:DEAD-box ATP-dependent RNA helicase 14 [Lathyrus oleraceus]|nr:DEAD-box ATP-dependent RNA helicase 14 [Pisum sativum]
MLTSSNARKEKLVQMAVNDLRESANSRTSKLQQEALTMQDSTSSIKAEWMIHMERTESNYHEDTSAVESGKQDLAEVLQICLKKAEVGSQQWRNAQESLLSLEKGNDASVDTIVQGGTEVNQALQARFSSVMATTVDDAVKSSSVQVQQSSQGRGRSPDFSDRYDRNGNGGSDESGSQIHQSSKGGTNSSHNNVANGTHVTGNLSSIKGHVASDTGPALTPEAYRRRHEITVTGDNVPPPVTSFASSGFPSEILKEVQNDGFSAPTPIQAQSWPIAHQSKDIVAIAKTGSGKTLGYLLPTFIHLKRTNNNAKMGPNILVLSPTRELATQIQDEVVKFSKTSRIACTCLYGGAPKGPQLRDIDRGADIVVATPGRLNDILEIRRISLHHNSYLVLDEADRMLDMGFEPQIRKVVNSVPARRKTLVFTATRPKEVRKIAADLLVNPVQVNIGNVDELVANKSITQHIEVLAHMETAAIGKYFAVTGSRIKDNYFLFYQENADRDHVLNQFGSGRTLVLVATDVAARGLDVKDIRVVVNYDFPTEESTAHVP